MAATVRLPAVAGTFYPGDPAALAAAVIKYLAEANPPPLKNVRAVIAPHAGYVYSGLTAGYAFKSLQSSLPGDDVTIYLLGPAHQVWFNGVSTGDFEGFSTPLGVAPVDQERVQALWALKTHYQGLPAAHQGEHCLEVELPFLQHIAPQLRLVPLLFGEVDACAVGRELAYRLRDEPDARVVVSSDLSHFHDYNTARRLDRAFLQHVLDGEVAKVAGAQRRACGKAAIVALMEMAAELSWTAHFLDYRTSGDTAGDKRRVVGYAAIAFTQGD